MESISLCKGKGQCPRIEIYDDKVKIGEEGNFCVLTKEQWRSLIEKIKKGELQ